MMSLFCGIFFILVAGIGILRLPDTLCRAHALSKALTLGIILVLLELMMQLGTTQASIKLLCAMLFQLVTIPLAGHVFALYACKRG